METLSPWKLTKSGFWIGVGFIVPSIGVYFLATFMLYSLPSSFWHSGAAESSNASMESYLSESEQTNQVKITQFREVPRGKQLLILGVVENTGNKSVRSVQIEAELLDDKKQMVYECSTYISKRLQKGERENFQINCGCGEQPAPAHKEITVRVVTASVF